jgi:hypothetical protein
MNLLRSGLNYVIPDSIHDRLTARGLKVGEIVIDKENSKSWTLRYITDESKKCLPCDMSFYFAEKGCNLMGWEWQILVEDGERRLVWQNDDYHKLRHERLRPYAPDLTDGTGYSGMMC